MKTISLSLKKTIDNSYNIIIDENFLNKISEDIKSNFPATSHIIITDENVDKYWGEKIQQSFQNQNIQFLYKILPAGEHTKSREYKAELENFLIKNNCDRGCCLVAFGGGVVGDLVGFTASTYLRGVPFIQIPTTLLSIVDSSVGGKTAIDIPDGKNLVGAFHQPKCVYTDIQFLETLSEKEFISGIAEIIKMAVCFDKEFFIFLEKNNQAILNRDKDSLKYIIQKSCELKSKVTSEDEKEKGIRAILNFGHTLGHAVESLSNFSLSHGECVAIGMKYESLISVKLKILKLENAKRLISCLENYKLPVNIPDNIDINSIIEKTLVDKKAHDKKAKYILLSSIGEVYEKNGFAHVVEDKVVVEVYNGV